MADTIRTSSGNLAQWTLTGAAKRLVPQFVRDVVVSAHAWVAPAPVALTDGATITWDTGGYATSHATVTLGGNRTLAITNAVSGCSGILVVTQDGTGSRTLTFPAGSKWAGGTVTLTTTAGAIDVLSWVYLGTTYYWTIGKAFA
jgi:hypothetical protein